MPPGRVDKLPDKAPSASPGMWGVLWPLPDCSCLLLPSCCLLKLGHGYHVACCRREVGPVLRSKCKINLPNTSWDLEKLQVVFGEKNIRYLKVTLHGPCLQGWGCRAHAHVRVEAFLTVCLLQAPFLC